MRFSLPKNHFMSSFTRTVFCVLFISCLLLLAGPAISQPQIVPQGTLSKRPNVNISPNCQGLVEYLPIGYDPNGTQRYPLLIFIMGINSHGSGSLSDLDRLFSSGGGFPTDQMKDSIWVESYTVNGQTYKFVVITPQFITDYNVAHPSAQDIDAVINYSLANYKIDPSRVYLTGNSSGGGPVWNYIGADSTGAYGYSNKIAAIVPFTAVVWPTQNKANVFKTKNIPVWAFANQFDTGVPVWFTEGFVDMINNPVGTAPNPPAKKTIFPDSGHISWWHPYMRTYTENGLNIYQWMLQYTRAELSILPVKFSMFNAMCQNGKVKLLWKTQNETNSKDFYVEKSVNGNIWTSIGSVIAAGQSSLEKTYNYIDPAGGNGFYRIVQVGFDGQKHYSTVIKNNCNATPSVSLFPNPVADIANLTIYTGNSTRLSYLIVDNKGAVVLRQEAMVPAGTNQVPVSVAALTRGLYTLQASWDKETKTIKFVKN
jgi:hypothetical protein